MRMGDAHESKTTIDMLRRRRKSRAAGTAAAARGGGRAIDPAELRLTSG
jgi:hypothetical protein